MEPTPDLITISLKEGLTIILAIISYTFIVAKCYFHLTNKLKTHEEKMVRDKKDYEEKIARNKKETDERLNHLDQLNKTNLTFRNELLTEVSKGYERQMTATQKMMKEWMDMNKEEHENINTALKENIKALTSLNTKFESHLSFEKGKSVNQFNRKP